jgi:hypothetical protein
MCIEGKIMLKRVPKKYDEDERCVQKMLVGNSEGNRPLERPGHRSEGNFKIDLKKARWDCVDWIHLAGDRVQWMSRIDTAQNFPVPLVSGNFLIG